MPVGTFGLDYPRSNIGRECEQAALGIMVERSSRTILHPFRPAVYAGCIAEIRTHTITVELVSAGKSDGVLMSYSHSAHFLKPIDIATVIHSVRAIVPVLLGSKHVEFLDHHIGRNSTYIRGMDCSILASLLRGYQHHSVASSGTIYRGSGTIFQNIDGLYVILIDIAHVSSGDTVNDYERPQTGCTGRYSSDLDTCLVVRVSRTGVDYRDAGHLALNQHGRVSSRSRKEILARHMGDCGGKFLLVHGSITHHHDFIEQFPVLLQNEFNVMTAIPACFLRFIA